MGIALGARFSRSPAFSLRSFPLGAEPPEYTLLILMPPGTRPPSTISSLRWSRLFRDQSFLAESGLTGLNSTTEMPFSRSRSKNSFGVLMLPTLS
jgi:hypothetical protein